MKSKAIIVDLDGTLANCEHRRHHLEKTDWKSFFSAMDKDTINEWVNDVVWACFSELGYELLLVTGRPSDYSQMTQDWVDSQDIPRCNIYMRSTGDFRPDEIVKKEIYEKMIEPKYEVKLVIDDRAKVVKMWRELGLNVFQCAEGNF